MEGYLDAKWFFPSLLSLDTGSGKNCPLVRRLNQFPT